MDRYDAFISYSHAADGRLAPAVQDGLQRLARKVFQRRALRVFRDETGLSTNPHLWGSIETAIDTSDWFVLLASPESSRSDWVNREVATWLQRKPLDHLLVVVTDGTLTFTPDGPCDPAGTTCLPEALVTALDSEPRWLDLRWARNDTQLDLRNGRFRAAIADLAAPIHGIPKDDLESDDVRQQQRAKRLASTGIAAVTILALVAAATAVVAVGQRNEASTQRDQAEAAKQQAVEQEQIAREQRDEADAQRERADTEADRATAAADAATAKAVSAQAAALSPTDIDLGLLLGAEGYRREQSPDTTAGLLSALIQTGPIDEFIRTLPDGIVDLAVTPDRSVLYALTVDGTVWAIDTATWQADDTPVISGLLHPWTLAIDDRGTRLAANGNDGATVVDLASGEVIARGLGGGTGTVGFDADGSRLVTAGLDEIALWDLATGVATHRTEGSNAATAFLPDGSVAVVFLGSLLLSVYRLGADGTFALDREKVLTVPSTGVAVSPQGDRIIAGGLDGRVQVLDATTLEVPAGYPETVAVRGSRIGDIFFNPSGTLFGLSSDDGSARVFDLTTGAFVSEAAGLQGAVWSEFVDDEHVVSATYVDEVALRWSTTPDPPIGTSQVLGSPAYALFLIDDGERAVLTTDGEVWVSPRDRLDAPEHRVSFDTGIFQLALSDDETTVAAYSFQLDDTETFVVGRTMHVLRLPDLTEVTSFELGDMSGPTMAFDPSGERLAIGFDDGSLAVYDARTGDQLVAPFPVDQFPCCLAALHWSRDGTRLATGGQDGVLRIWDTDSWDQVAERVLAPDQSAIRSISDAPDGTMIVPTEAGSVFLLDPLTGEPVDEEFTVGGTQFQNAAVTIDGTVLAVTSRDGKLRLWDLQSHRIVGPAVPSGTGYTPTIERLDDTHVITTGGEDGRFIIWDLDPASWAAKACDLAGRNLTRDEWDRYVGGDYEITCDQWPEGG